MKKKVLKMFSLFLAVIVIYVLYELCLPSRVFFWDNQGTVVIHDSSKKLTEADSKKIKEIFEGYWCCYDEPSCGGFTDEAYIEFGFNKFLPGYDTCGTIKTGNKYFTLNEADKKEFFGILNKYGASFPMY